MEHKNGYLVVLELSRSVDPTRSGRADSSADEPSDPELNRGPATAVKPGLRGRLAAAITALRYRRSVDLGDRTRSDEA